VGIQDMSSRRFVDELFLCDYTPPGRSRFYSLGEERTTVDLQANEASQPTVFFFVQDKMDSDYR
jgi:hypothetical protein